MNQIVTKGIVLTRVNFGEADRILTVLTPDHGKLRLMAKGSRRIRSKLAGGIELFSVSDITFIRGKGDIGTLVSARMLRHYPNIVKDIDRTMLGYELIKQLDKATEDSTETEYFVLLEQAFVALDTLSRLDVINLWFAMQLLRLNGHTPNLTTDENNRRLEPSKSYNFNLDNMAFAENPNGKFNADHIKFLRLGFAGNAVNILQKVQGSADLVTSVTPIITDMASMYLRQ